MLKNWAKNSYSFKLFFFFFVSITNSNKKLWWHGDLHHSLDVGFKTASIVIMLANFYASYVKKCIFMTVYMYF